MTLFAPDKGFIDKTALARNRKRVFPGLLSNITYNIYIYLPSRWIYFDNDNLIQRQYSV